MSRGLFGGERGVQRFFLAVNERFKQVFGTTHPFDRISLIAVGPKGTTPAELRMHVMNECMEVQEIPDPVGNAQLSATCKLQAESGGVGTRALETATKIFLVNNIYEKSGDADKEGGSLLMDLKIFAPDSVVYLFGNGMPIPGKVWVDIGDVYIFAAESNELKMRHQPTNTYLTNLNLSNVTTKTLIAACTGYVQVDTPVWSVPDRETPPSDRSACCALRRQYRPGAGHPPGMQRYIIVWKNRLSLT